MTASTTFLYSDPHFGHAGVCRFLRADGSKLRPWDDAAAMDEAMVDLFNQTVKPGDKVYFLGDCVINRKALPTLGRLNGDKILIKGNHDIFRLEEYTRYFRDVRSYHVLHGLIMSHIPVHEDSLGRFGTNIHGHLHDKRVMKDGAVDPRYHCVCVEQTDFRPIPFDTVLANIKAEGGSTEMRQGNGSAM